MVRELARRASFESSHSAALGLSRPISLAAHSSRPEFTLNPALYSETAAARVSPAANLA